MIITRWLRQNAVSCSPRSASTCLKEFKQLVSEQCRCQKTYHGWPPEDRIPIARGTIPPLERGIFVMNRTLKDGLRTEPTLVLTCGTKPMLMLNSTEFEAFVERLPWIKEQMNEFYKLI